jgi:hypothetical protein
VEKIVKKKKYVLLKLRKNSVKEIIVKGEAGNVAIFNSESSARKIQTRFPQYGVYLLTKV